MAKSQVPIVPLNQDLKAVEREYRQKVRILEAQPLIKKIGFWLLAIISIGLMTSVLVYFAWYVAIGAPRERGALVNTLRNIATMRAVGSSHQAVPLNVIDSGSVNTPDGFVDYYLLIENPNTDWAASFDYTIFLGNEGEGGAHGFVMPGETKYLTILHSPGGIANGELQIHPESMRWMRIDRHLAPDPVAWVAERQNFTVSDALYTPAADAKSASRTSFAIKNNTPYGLYEPVFIVALRRGDQVIAINQAVLPNFASGETRTVEINWIQPLPATVSIEVQPSLNLLDPTIYIPPAGESTMDVRDSLPARR